MADRVTGVAVLVLEVSRAEDWDAIIRPTVGPFKPHPTPLQYSQHVMGHATSCESSASTSTFPATSAVASANQYRIATIFFPPPLHSRQGSVEEISFAFDGSEA